MIHRQNLQRPPWTTVTDSRIVRLVSLLSNCSGHYISSSHCTLHLHPCCRVVLRNLNRATQTLLEWSNQPSSLANRSTHNYLNRINTLGACTSSTLMMILWLCTRPNLLKEDQESNSWRLRKAKHFRITRRGFFKCWHVEKVIRLDQIIPDHWCCAS